jgi:hypothetical protein
MIQNDLLLKCVIKIRNKELILFTLHFLPIISWALQWSSGRSFDSIKEGINNNFTLDSLQN